MPCHEITLAHFTSKMVAGVADCYFAQRLPWLIPVMPREASHSFIPRVSCSAFY